MRILITGSSGLIGSRLYKDLKEKYDVLPTDIKGNDSAYLDITSYQSVIDTLDYFKPDIVIHLAAKVAGIPSLKDPKGYYFTNIIGTINVLEAMRQLKIKNLIFFSSWSSLGSKIKLPITEKTLQLAENPYGVSKICCEYIIKNYSRLYGIHVVILRPTMIYGENQLEKNVLQQIVDSMITRKKFQIYGTGEHTREFLYAGDVAKVVSKVIDKFDEIKGKDRCKVYILGTENPYSIKRAVEIGAEISPFEIEFVDKPTWTFSQASDMSKIKKEIGVNPSEFIDLREGLKRCYNSRK